MSVKSLAPALGLVCALVAGCATQPASDTELQPRTATSGEESQARARARIHTELAASYYQLGNMGVALEEVREALQSDSTYGPAHNAAGLVYGALKRDSQAEASFQRALSINALDSDANNNYGEFLCARKREQESIRYFMTAVENPLYQRPDRSYVNAGICARRQGDVGAAENYFRQALRVRPNQPQALYNLAELEYEGRKYDAARDHVDLLMRVAQPNAEALWLAVRIERKRGDAASAASYAQQLQKNFPGSKEARALSAGQFE
ncbi:MAG: type IV pilus biogenesis/stability protein PilW [Betaproteobacteria bacterium]|nr:type IV pilus biogenesis/stability protein PilW [Betaproteobacteria bacterium]MDH3438125.1 type IV pilus biogenesis/stability protein PilW [Betaproteobacteria bacterium]